MKQFNGFWKNVIWIICFVISVVFSSCMQSGKAKSKDLISSDSISVASDKEPVMQHASQILAKKEIPVLCYHRIESGNTGAYTVSPTTFENHMKVLSDSGYQTILPEALYQYLVFNKSIPEKSVLITFDDSRVEHATLAAPIMEKYGFKGSFFIMTITYGKKNYMTTDQIKHLSESGHCIGLHTWDHTMVTKFKDSLDWAKQIEQPKKKLEAIVGKKIEFFAYPNGVFNQTAALELKKHFKISFSLYSKRDSVCPLQTVRRLLATEISASQLMKSIHRSYK